MAADQPPEPSPITWVRAHPWQTAVLAAAGLLILIIFLFAIFPQAAPAWTGFGLQPHPNGWIMIPYRTLWDWMGLLLVPLFIALGAALLGRQQLLRQLEEQEKEREIAEQNRENEQQIAQEQAEQGELEAYYQNMGQLMLDYGLGSGSEPESVRILARARTLIALEGINGRRKGLLLRFLYESGLINAPEPVVSLYGANFDDMLLRFGDLQGADLAGTTLREASLIGANFSGADLSKAHFNRASLRCAILDGAHAPQARFSGASLHDATLRKADLTGANFSHVDAPGLDLRGAQLDTAVLVGADLREALLQGTQLAGAVFLRPGQSHTDEGAINLTGATYDAKTTWPPEAASFKAQAAEGPPPEERADSRCAPLAEQYRQE